jgi:hypothetical protein
MSRTCRSRTARALGAGALMALAAVVAHAAVHPEPALAALRSAAGSGAAGGGGFSALGDFMDRITTYLIWLAVPAAGLGAVAGGAMLIAGSPRATRVLALTAVGFAIVVTAKGLAA